MANYVDGFVIPVPRHKLDEYKALARTAAAVWLEYGALEYVECIADDVPLGEVTSFPRAVLLENDELVVFSWITYESREDRDRINEQVMKDPRLSGMKQESMPFDGKRMFFGGFRPFLSRRAP